MFSLNLSIGREGGTLYNKDPKRNLEKRLNAALNKHGLRGLPVAFVIEAERVTGRVHLHGVLVPGAHSKKVIERALAEAGGKLKGQQRTRQCKIEPFRDPGPDGWHRYITEDLRFTSRHVDGDLIYISQPLIRLRSSFYEEVIRGGAAANTTSGMP
ncbi:hypothetical protein GI374_12935 [Paracoccus sp. S-4012]|uniref:hypothetical protein n=1 Tax=Paracoccus sp. S-4012 TaxID=2665648 RepID=UPI0012AFDC34|nr:hypothetical protein [Paracoccus sp. S-4012]MRX51332.1 hypothetical protein [Paracoccus sp. S-4012]